MGMRYRQGKFKLRQQAIETPVVEWVFLVARRYCATSTFSCFKWWKSLGKAQTWRVYVVNLGLGNQNSHPS